MTRRLIGCRIYWDSQDPRNEGWSWNTYYSDGHEESGAWEWDLQDHPDRSELVKHIENLAYQHDAVIDRSDVVVDLSIDGGIAEWSTP